MDGSWAVGLRMGVERNFDKGFKVKLMMIVILELMGCERIIWRREKLRTKIIILGENRINDLFWARKWVKSHKCPEK